MPEKKKPQKILITEIQKNIWKSLKNVFSFAFSENFSSFDFLVNIFFVIRR